MDLCICLYLTGRLSVSTTFSSMIGTHKATMQITSLGQPSWQMISLSLVTAMELSAYSISVRTCSPSLFTTLFLRLNEATVSRFSWCFFEGRILISFQEYLMWYMICIAISNPLSRLNCICTGHCICQAEPYGNCHQWGWGKQKGLLFRGKGESNQ